MNLQSYQSEIDIDIREMRSIFLNVAMNIQVYTQNINSTYNEIKPKLPNENMNQYMNWWQNFFSNNNLFEDIPIHEVLFRAFGAIICTVIILTTLIGNILVIVVVTRFHRMRTVTNILLARYKMNNMRVFC